MRITREALLKVVDNTVTQRTRADRSLLSVYLCGSLLSGDHLMGGSADIDLVIIHTDSISAEREIVPITDEVHLDIAHHYHRDYRQTRQLREHPWLGPTVYACKILHDPQHFMDFTQASVRGQFYRSDHVLQRSRKFAEQARQIWMSFYSQPAEPGPQEVGEYLKAVEHAANAIASLSGPPLTERRFLLRFPARAEAIGRGGMYHGLLGLLGAPNVDVATLNGWLDPWQSAFQAVPAESAPARLHSDRQAYYQKAFESLLKGEQPNSVLWTMLRTWTQAIKQLESDASERAEWNTAFEKLGLVGDGFADRVEAMDAYLDMVEEALDRWGQENGALLG
jgi:hypothetical protein